jgi:DNA-binding winged helix-turn-helix (wHTH) protein
LDLAEDGRRLVVVEDLHLCAADEVSSLLSVLARYARKSRWLFTSRVDPALPDLGGQLLHLEGLSEVELWAAARALSERSDEVELRRAVQLARGSPCRLRRLLCSVAEHRPLDDDVESEVRACAEVMAVVQGALPEGALERMIPSWPAVRSGLERRGFLERASGGLRLHDLARAEVLDAMTPARREQVEIDLASLLVGCIEPESVLERARLLAKRGAIEPLSLLLRDRGEMLLAEGYAHEAFAIVAGLRSLEIDRIRLRLAIETGRAAEQSIPLPSPAEPRDVYLYALLRYRGSDFVGAADAALTARRAAVEAGDGDLAAETTALRARALAAQGQVVQARAELEQLVPAGRKAHAIRATLLAWVSVTLQDVEAARTFVGEARSNLEELDAVTRTELGRTLAWVLTELGALHEARVLLDALFPAGRAESGDLSRQLVLLRGYIALDSGRLAEAEHFFDKLTPLAASAQLVAYSAEVGVLMGAIEAGALADIHQRIAAFRAAAPARWGEREGWARLLELRAANALGRPAASPDRGVGESSFETASALLRLASAENELRNGRASAALLDELSASAFPPAPEVTANRGLLRARAEMLRGDFDAARREAVAARDTAEASGYRLLVAHALTTLCEIHALVGDRAGLEATSARLGELATAMPSARFSCASRLFALPRCHAGEALRALVDLAAPERPDIDAARRARALIGWPAVLDAIDRAVVPALSSMLPFEIRPANGEAVGPDGDRPHRAWLIDPERKRVVTERGSVSFDRADRIFGLLQELAARGAASKEQLVVRVWGVASYHPLRHDNRLKLAVRKLRSMLEADRSASDRILTSSDGYRLIGPVRVVAPRR